MPASLFYYGPLVKRLRQRPLTPLTWVRFPHGSPKNAPQLRLGSFLVLPCEESNRTAARVTKKLSLEKGWAFSFVKNKYWNRGVWKSKSPGPASAYRGAKTALWAVFRAREVPRAVRQFAKRKHAANRRRRIEQTGRGASGPRPYREKTESEQADLLAEQRKNGG